MEDSKSKEDEADFLPLTTFHSFGELPREIRDMIWEQALDAPRTIEVQATFMVFCCVTYFDDNLEEYVDTGHTYFGKFFAKIPPLLHACRESREIALPVYEICMCNISDEQLSFHRSSTPGNLHEAQDVSGIWFQPLRDTIYIPYPPENTHVIWCETDVGDIKMNNVLSIAVDVESPVGDDDSSEVLGHSTHIFARRMNVDPPPTHLKTFFMVFQDSAEHWLAEEVNEMKTEGSCDLFENLDPIQCRIPDVLIITLKRFLEPENSDRLRDTGLGTFTLASLETMLYVPEDV